MRWRCVKCNEQLVAAYADVTRHASVCCLTEKQIEEGYVSKSQAHEPSSTCTADASAADGMDSAADLTISMHTGHNVQVSNLIDEVPERNTSNSFQAPEFRRCTWGRRLVPLTEGEPLVDDAPTKDINVVVWWCDRCDAEFHLTRLQWLRHVQQHV